MPARVDVLSPLREPPVGAALDVEEAYYDTLRAVYRGVLAHADDLAAMGLAYLDRVHQVRMARADGELHTIARKRELDDLAVTRTQLEVERLRIGNAQLQDDALRTLTQQLAEAKKQLTAVQRREQQRMADELPGWELEPEDEP